MEELRVRKYARFILSSCLKLQKGQPLLLVGQPILKEFMKMMEEEAKKLGCEDIGLQYIDRYYQRDLLLNKSLEDCLNDVAFDRHLYNEYAEKNGAFAIITSPIPGINDGVDPKKLNAVSEELENRIQVFRDKETKGLIPWCIFGVPNEEWAKVVLPNSAKSVEELWEVILDICHINSNPEKEWDSHFQKLDEICRTLNEFKIESLHYTCSNGTDITFELPENYVFQSGKDRDWIVNMPTLEVFTTPDKTGVNGIVYNTKPLFHNGVLIDDFWIRFEKGKAVEVHASKNEEFLKEVIQTDDNASFLGEIALVDYDSKINQSGLLFQETLYDENASCHLALGRGFPECILNGYEKSLETLQKEGMNVSKIHVDFMIGHRDLKIVAKLRNGEEKVIMEHGNIIL